MNEEILINKNKALIITDLHIRPQYIEAAKKLLKKIEKEVEEKKPEYVFILGDVFHYKDRLFASCLSVFLDFLENITKTSKVICLVGNHDWGIPYTVHSLDSFRHLENLIIVDDYYKLDDNNGFVSYCREKDRFDKMLENLGPVKRLYGHLDINEFKVGSGWEEINAYSKPEDFKGYEQVFSGHLHLAQERKLENGTEIIYIGTGYTTDFGESDQAKRILLLDIVTGEYSSIDTELTLHKTLKIKAGDEFPVIPMEEIENGVEYRLMIEGTKEQFALIQRPKNYQAKIVYNFTTQDAARVDLSVTDNRKQTLEKYVDYELDKSFGGEDKAGLDKEKLIKLGEGILNKYN